MIGDHRALSALILHYGALHLFPESGPLFGCIDVIQCESTVMIDRRIPQYSGEVYNTSDGLEPLGERRHMEWDENIRKPPFPEVRDRPDGTGPSERPDRTKPGPDHLNTDLPEMLPEGEPECIKSL